MTQKVKLHPNKQPTFLLLYAITDEKTIKLMQGLLSTSKSSPAEIRSNNSVRYTLLKTHIPWLAWHTQGRVFKPRLLQQVLRFVDRIYTVAPCNTWSSGGTAHEGEGCDESIRYTVSDAIVRS